MKIAVIGSRNFTDQVLLENELNTIKEKVKPKGHYEKVIRKKEDYIFVPGFNPSGLPGAYLVTDKEGKGH